MAKRKGMFGALACIILPVSVPLLSSAQQRAPDLVSSFPQTSEPSAQVATPHGSRAVHKISLVALVQANGNWRAGLRDLTTGEIILCRPGEFVFNHKVIDIIPENNTVVLEHAGRELVLVMGGPAPSTPAATQTVDPQWIADWRASIAELSPVEQQTAREQMRSYWQQQWVGGLAEAVSKMKPEDQLRIRGQISRLWRD